MSEMCEKEKAWENDPLNQLRRATEELSALRERERRLVEAQNAQSKAPDVVFQALVDAREYFAERADAEYFTDSQRAHGNTEMQLMSAMDEALAALSRAATGEK